MDRLGKMTAFVKVVETGSFTAAAKALHLSATMVSRHIRELEDQIGVRLLHRTTRSVSLTEVGRLFYERCSPLLIELDELENSVTALHAAPRGLLRVSAPPAFGAAYIAPIVAEFAHLYAGMTTELILSERMVDLVDEGFDIAIHMGELPDSTVQARQLTLFQMIVCASPDYLQRHGTPRTPEELTRHNCFSLGVPGLLKDWTFFDNDGGKFSGKVSGNFRTNSPGAQLSAALCGHGITLQPSYLVKDHLAAMRLVNLFPDLKGPEIPVRAIYLPGRYVATKVRVFMDFLITKAVSW